jgi:hypothetical protein
MEPIKDLFSLLKTSLTFENPAILTFGPKWFRENIVFPVTDLITVYIDCIDIGKLDKTQHILFFMALQAMGDIAFLLRGFGTANYWYKKYHSFDIKEQEIIYDIAYTYELMRDFNNAKKYYHEYFGDNHEFELSENNDYLELPIRINIYDQLINFQPNFIIDNYGQTEQTEIYQLVTTSYFMLGEEADNNVYSRMETYFKNTNNPSIDYVDLFYASDYFCNQPQIWKIMLQCKPNIELIDHNFSILSSGTQESKPKIQDTLLLHFVRSCNDIESMKNLIKNDYLHSAANTCVKFFKEQNRMPDWKEFYVLMNACQLDTNE